jgi:predicted acylesterase/phospholipase RssA
MDLIPGLANLRIWLSGSIPKEASPEEEERLVEFTKLLAAECFRNGAWLVYGCHPTLTRTLLYAAYQYRTAHPRKAPLRLIASALYRQENDGGYAGIPLTELQRDAEVHVTPITGDRDLCLARLRDQLAAEADILVAIGGNWWRDDPTHAGVPAEFNRAINRGIPSFLLGGLGGATAGYLKQHPEILRQARNGLDQGENEDLAREYDLPKLVSSILKQMARLPIGRRETSPGQPFRILCLDGGGIRGAFTASVLAKWERMTELRAAEYFDLIAGTSTGGILALGLGLGLEAEKIVEFYSRYGPEIFPMMNFRQRVSRWLRAIARTKFEASVLEEKLRIAYGQPDRYLRDIPQRMLITAYNTTSDNLHLFRTSHHPTVTGHDQLLAVTVARATSAAPTYFKAAKIGDESAAYEAVDGGVWANSPVLAALSEAVGVLKVPLDRIDMLSVGTTDVPSIIGAPRIFTGQLGWARRAPSLLMKAQIQAALNQAKGLLGKDRFLRVDDSAATRGLDDVSSIPMLISKGAEVGETSYPDISARFLNGLPAAAWR